MASLHRRIDWMARRAKERPLLTAVGFACAAAVVIEVAVFTNFFGLADRRSNSTGPTGPDLNPYHQVILAIVSNVTYFGPVGDYFPTLNHTNLCGHACPESPRTWSSGQASILPEIGVYFFYNVTNTASIDVNLSLPVLTTSGPVSTLFYLETFCCYSTVTQPYFEMLTSQIQLTAGTGVGLEGYAFTTVPLPAVAAGGYTLYVNFTSN